MLLSASIGRTIQLPGQDGGPQSSHMPARPCPPDSPSERASSCLRICTCSHCAGCSSAAGHDIRRMRDGMHGTQLTPWQITMQQAARAVDLRLGVAEIFAASALCFASQSWSSVCAVVAGSLCVCVCISFWVAPHACGSAGFEFRDTRPQPHDQTPPPLIADCRATAAVDQTVCTVLSVVYSRGKIRVFPPSHSPSFGEAFPTALSCSRPALSLLRAHTKLSRSSPRPVVVLVLPFSLLAALASYYCYCAG